MIGFVCVDKPSGPTSRDVVDAVVAATGMRKAGHAGTLDPMATGAVVVAIGRATRLIRYLQEFDKEYFATAKLGVATDTLDADGVVTESRPMRVNAAAVEEAAQQFVGNIQQIPPMVSALKVGGTRLYELARRGEEVAREPRPVRVVAFDVLSVGDGEQPLVKFRVVCGKGTYVRVLADDLAKSLGGRAHLTQLRRTRIGSVNVETDGVALSEVGERWREALISPGDAIDALPALVVDRSVAAQVSHGAKIDEELGAERVRVIDQSGELLAVYRQDGPIGRAEVVVA